MRKAIDMAVQDHKAALASWDVEHVALDDGDGETGDWTRAKEEANAQAAAGDPATIAYIGPYNSGAAMLSMPLLNRAGLLQMLPSATWPGLTQEGWGAGEPQKYYPTGKQTVVRMMPPDSTLASEAAEMARTSGVRTAITLDDGSDYSLGMARVFAEAAQEHAMTVTQQLELSSQSLAHLSDPANPLPDALFFAPSSLSSVSKLAAAMKNRQPRSGVYLTDVALTDQLSAEDRQNMEGWHILSNDGMTISPSPMYTAFARRFKQTYSAEPSRFAANAYDLASLALETATKTGQDRESIIKGVLATQKPDGITGPIRFTPDGDIVGRAISSYKLIAGKFEPEP